MTYTQVCNGVDILEKTRRMEVVEKINILWDRKNACIAEADKKEFEKKIQRIVRREASWLKKSAWFLYY